MTYGLSPQADIRAVNLELGRDGARFDVVVSDALAERGRTIADLFLPMFGQHNVQNSLAAVAVAEELGLGDDALRDGLAQLQGRQAPLHQDRRVERRHRDRRLRPSPGRDRRGAEGGARPSSRARSSPWCSRIATAASPTSSTGSAPASTTPTSCSSPTSTPPARRRSRASTRDALVAGLAAHGHRNVRALARPARSRAAGRRAGPARRHGRMPRRRLDHSVGQRAARRARGARHDGADAAMMARAA